MALEFSTTTNGLTPFQPLTDSPCVFGIHGMPTSGRARLVASVDGHAPYYPLSISKEAGRSQRDTQWIARNTLISLPPLPAGLFIALETDDCKGETITGIIR